MKPINYEEACKDILSLLGILESNLKIYNSFELAEYIKDEIETIQEQLKKARKIKQYNKTSFNELIELSCTIEECLSEIEMVSGSLIKDLNKLPEDRKKAVYLLLGIKEISPEYEGLSDKLYYLLSDMFKIIWDIHERYLDYCDDEEL